MTGNSDDDLNICNLKFAIHMPVIDIIMSIFLVAANDIEIA